MSNKSGTSGQVIPLPRGGGALQGIGETFSPDLFTGTGNLTIPLDLPRGRNGFQPELSLAYSSGQGNGPFGLGWDVPVAGVSRKTAKGVPRYGEDDTFVLSGSEDLVAVAQPAPGVTRFRPRVEGTFARIDRIAPDAWRVTGGDGMINRYGGPGAVVADPTDPARIFAWRLAETADPFGNRLVFSYRRDGAQLYLDRVRYVDFERDGQARFLVSVSFVYEPRPDAFSDRRAGFEVRTALRCTRIEVRTHPGDADLLVRSYELDYVDERVRAGELPAESLPLNRVSLLSQVRVVGHDGERREELAPLEFGYTRFAPEQRRFQPMDAVDELPPLSLADDGLEMVELFANGLPDIVRLNGGAEFWRNLGAGVFDRPQAIDEVPAGVRLGDPGVQLADMNGDGRADLLTLPDGYSPLTFRGRWGPRVPYAEAPRVELGGRDIRLVDLDGDGVVDALRTAQRFELFFNDPRDGWQRVETRERRPLAEFPDLSFDDERVKLADITGDGLQDFVLVRPGRVDYWPYLGHGRWGRRLTMGNSPTFADAIDPGGEFDPARVLFGDLDGDGLDDIAYVGVDRISFCINQGGGGWSDSITIRDTPPFTDIDGVRLADMLGSGMAGVLWTFDRLPGEEGAWRFLDPAGGAKPYLLERVDNHMGAVTRIAYAPSTVFYAADRAEEATAWRTPLPFPVQVIERVEVLDGLSGGKLTTRYRYRHGYWDGREREFRGFGLVEQVDTEEFERFNRPGLHGEDAPFARVEPQRFSPPTLTRTWFHLGDTGDELGDRAELDLSGEYWPGDAPALERPPDTVALLAALSGQRRADALRALAGSMLRTELFALDGSDREDRPFTVTELQYGLREIDEAFLPHLVAQRTTQWERGEEPLTQATFIGDYDAHGLPGTQLDVAVPRGRDFRVAGPAGDPYLAVLTTTTYAQRDTEDAYLVDRVASLTAHELVNDGSSSLAGLVSAASPRRLLAQTLNLYDGAAFTGGALGDPGDFGALVRSERLVLTEDLLRDLHGEIPAYLLPGGEPPAEYPPEFVAALAPLAGYALRDGGYFAATVCRRYDFHDGAGRGLVVATRDAPGHETAIAHDDFGLLTTGTTDPVGLQTRAEHDYRAMQPRLVVDPNGNRSECTYTPLGLLDEVFMRGKGAEGDRVRPGTRFEYDFAAFAEGRGPSSVRTIRREQHEGERTMATADFSDGFGRVIQSRVEAEDVTFGDAELPAPLFGDGVLPADQAADSRLPVTGRSDRNVVVSGWQTFDNKGRVVERFEPFFSRGLEFLSPEGERAAAGRDILGQRGTLFYDARGEVIRALDPDGAERRVVRGVPDDVAAPETFAPTPWEAYTYDANDNAARSHPGDPATERYRHHRDTPASIVVDALGRTVASVERNRTRDGPVREAVTRYRYDLPGNLVEAVDALGRTSARHVYDLTGEPLATETIDGGARRVVLDAAGNEIERRDGRGALLLQSYDALNRPVRRWARDRAGAPLTLREVLEYGDGGDAGQPSVERAASRAANRLGRLHRHHDEAGLLTVEAYDFKGNVVERRRRAIRDEVLLAALDEGGFRVDWEAGEAVLEDVEHTVTIAYDALDRAVSVRHPAGADGRRRELRYAYARGGALERIELDGRAVLEHAAYNARGQRTLAALGDGVLVRCAYDPRTFRLARLRSERATRPEPLTFRPAGAVLQDLAYEYDLAGNVLAIHDRAPGSGAPPQPDALDRAFAYDALYRLVSATGRELAAARVGPPWTDGPTPLDVNQARGYIERYDYDRAGSLIRMTRRAQGGGGVTRRLQPEDATNRLRSLTLGDARVNYEHDANGNIVSEGASRHFTWDHADQLVGFSTQLGDGPPSLEALYLYDGGGGRVKKFVRTNGRFSSTVYVDGLFERHRHGRTAGPAPRVELENDLMHVGDGEQRVATVRAGPAHPDDGGPAVQYHLGDHLGASVVVVGGDTLADAAFVNREDYTPFGETSFGSFARKRYRFNGAERDEESSLCRLGARYYAPWLARWVSCDPLAQLATGPPARGDALNAFGAFAANPLHFVDPAGLQPQPATASPKDEFKSRLRLLVQQGWIIPTDPEGKPETYEAPELAGKRLQLGETTLEYRRSILLTHRTRVETEDGQPQVLEYHIFEEAEPSLLQKALRFITPALEWASLLPVVGDFIDLAMPGVYAAQGRYDDAALAAAAAAAPGLSIGILKKTGLGEKAIKLVGKSADEAGALTHGAGSSVRRMVEEPDVYSIELIRWRKEAKAGSRGVTPADRAKARAIADRLGHTGPVDVGHSAGTPHVFSKPGDPIWLHATPRGKNRRGGPPLRKEAERVRRNPQLGIPVRNKGQ